MKGGLRSRLHPTLAGLDDGALEEALRGAGAYWPAGGTASAAFRARFPDPDTLMRMAALAARGRIRFWQPWHMEKTHRDHAAAPERRGAPAGSPGFHVRRVRWKRAPEGDEEWPHALARFGHMLDLAAAAALGGGPGMVAAWQGYLESYLAARAPADPFWSNRLDASLRLLNLVRSYDLIRPLPGLPPRLRAAALTAMLREGDWLAERLGRHVNNWEFFLACSLAAASACLRDVCEVEAWGAAARSRLDEILRSEVRPDGTFSEQAPMYQGEVALVLLDYLLALKTRGLPPHPEAEAAAAALAGSLAALADPEGRIPPVGDSDRFPADYVAGFAAAVLGPTPPRPVTDKAPYLAYYPDAALAAVRWPLAAGSAAAPAAPGGGEGWLLFDATGKPPARRRFHSHADDLHFLLHTSSGPLLTDPGRFTYAPAHPGPLPLLGSPFPGYPRGRLRPVHDLLFPSLRELNDRDWRAYFRGSAAHNTVTREGRDHPGYQDDAAEGRPVRLAPPVLRGSLALLRGEAEDPAGIFRHARLLAGVLPGLWLVVDRAGGRGSPCAWQVSHHFGPGVSEEAAGNPLSLRLRGGGAGGGARLAWACRGGTGAVLETVDDWISPEYNLKVKARTARIHVREAAEFSLATLILPREPAGGVSVAVAWSPQGVVCAQVVAEGEELRVWARPEGGPWTADAAESDAVLAFARMRGGEPVAAGFLEGGYLRLGGRDISGMEGGSGG